MEESQASRKTKERGRSVEKDRKDREMSKPNNQNMVSVSTQTSCEPFTDGLQGNEQQQVEPIDPPGNYREIQPIEETGENTRVRLARRPDTVVERSVFNNYALYAIILACMLGSDQERFGIWATQRFNIAPNMPVQDALLQLDDMGVISVTHQNELRVFFEGIRRFDLVHVVDQYLTGDYACLREINLRNLIRVFHDDRQPAVNGEYDVGQTPEDLNAF